MKQGICISPSSSKNLVHRIKEHIKGKKSNEILQRAIKKYGGDKFSIIIISIVDKKSLTEEEETTTTSWKINIYLY